MLHFGEHILHAATDGSVHAATSTPLELAVPDWCASVAVTDRHSRSVLPSPVADSVRFFSRPDVRPVVRACDGNFRIVC